MILLELTEKEAEAVQKLMKIGWLNSNYGYEEKAQITNLLNSVTEKMTEAQKPKKDRLITAKEFLHIMSLTKDQYHLLPLNLHISDKPVEEKDLKHISFANALLMWLNGNSILKKLVKFDYTDKSAQYEITEE